jgi:DNA-binding GntR family transcriptional regulator
MIITGELGQGERITERQLAERAGSSRVPVREALLRLSSEGLLINVPRWGFQVRRYTVEDAIELYELREAVEGMAARLAVEKASDKLLENVFEIHEKMARSAADEVDAEGINMLLDKEFHKAILRASGNERFLRIYSLFHDENICLNLSNLGWKPTPDQLNETRQHTISSHTTIVDALRRRDGNLAESAMREHIRHAKEAAKLQLSKHKEN